MLIEQPPQFFRLIYPSAIWRMDSNEKAVYLTFDDGPIPEVTEWVLKVLDQYKIKATFFMVGDNVRKYPEEYAKVVARGHRIGNHTFHHVRGFAMNAAAYSADTLEADALLHTDLFRPPHGYMSTVQYKWAKAHYKIVMWDLVTRDYSKRLNGQQVLQKIKKYVRNGSILTFHDSLKSRKKIEFALPAAIEWLQKEGYGFKIF